MFCRSAWHRCVRVRLVQTDDDAGIVFEIRLVANSRDGALLESDLTAIGETLSRVQRRYPRLRSG